MPLYDCGDPDCEECQRVFGPDRRKAIAKYERRAALYALPYEERRKAFMRPPRKPEMWFRLKGDERLKRCASEGCGGQPTWRLEVGDVGSNYCSGCKAEIEAQERRKT